MYRPISPKPIGKGFSLVEMAIILVIMSLMVAALLPRIISGSKRDVMAEAKRMVRSARNEVLGYAKANGCALPPAAWFSAQAAHRWGRLGAVAYLSGNRTLTLVNGTNQTAAFLIVSNGTDQTNDTDYSANPTDLRPVHDDIVDFATPAFVQSLCP
jgi:type II secretory pathway pseudopilin PulG